jgi:hypothetical protein
MPTEPVAYGLTTRWSLTGTGPELAEQLRRYVRDTSVARFTGRDGLAFKVWSLAEGEFFGGTYLWADQASRAAFAEALLAEPSPVETMVGHPPRLEYFECPGVADGAAGVASLISGSLVG